MIIPKKWKQTLLNFKIDESTIQMTSLKAENKILHSSYEDDEYEMLKKCKPYKII